jgi:hypothetical protein
MADMPFENESRTPLSTEVELSNILLGRWIDTESSVPYTDTNRDDI